MNILYISDKKKWGGIVSWMQKTAKGLQKKGHKVWILSNKKSKLLQYIDNDVMVIPKNLGIDFNPIMALWLMIFIKRYKIDLVVTNITKEVLIGGIAAKLAKVTNIRRIGTEKDFDDPKIRKFYNLIDLTIAPCEFVAKYIIEHNDYVKPQSICHVYNGCEPRLLSNSEIRNIKQKFQIPINKIILGTTCQFSKTKNVLRVIETFAKLAAKFDDIYLVLAGEGPQRKIIEEKVKNLQLTDQITITGFVKDTLDLASTYDIGILFSNLEGFSNSVVEYMGAGTPVICTNVGGQNEIVQDNYNGFLIEPGNQEQLYERLLYLIKNPKAREKLSRNAYYTAKNNFSEVQIIDNLEKIFKNYARK
jgi:glycosyltransferase involved in cell wall biosynthesis